MIKKIGHKIKTWTFYRELKHRNIGRIGQVKTYYGIKDRNIAFPSLYRTSMDSNILICLYSLYCNHKPVSTLMHNWAGHSPPYQ